MGAEYSAARKPSKAELEKLREGAGAACVEAARRIAEADVLLLCTGAGFSADSGLAVYADVAKVEAYAARGLEYHDICDPCWLDSDPELFWGFWGQCFNDYRNTAPHEGYQIIHAWAERRFRCSALAESVRQSLDDAGWPDVAAGDPTVPYLVDTKPGAFFAFTSNVDAHHFDWFEASELYECHGNTELYQCAGHCQGIWRAPLDFRFAVDAHTMLAQDSSPADLGSKEDDDAQAWKVGMPADGAAPRIGHVRGGGRPHTLRHMPGPVPDASAAGFGANHPRCTACGGQARPAILMFGDGDWQEYVQQEQRWEAWRKSVMKAAEDWPGPPVRAVILEFGAGKRVPTVRHTSEETLQQWVSAGIDAHLVRVNPDLPRADFVGPKGTFEDRVISIMDRGLPTILKIDAAMSEQHSSTSS